MYVCANMSGRPWPKPDIDTEFANCQPRFMSVRLQKLAVVDDRDGKAMLPVVLVGTRLEHASEARQVGGLAAETVLLPVLEVQSRDLREA